MSTGEPASDSFIGRLFNRIKPGSSYAAFPWKSWDKICTILETMRGRGIRIKRSTNDTAWELDATSGAALDSPQAYSVYVHDPKDQDAEIPDVMKGDTALTVYCYVPCYTQNESNLNVSAGANGPKMGGKVGDYVTDDWPNGFDSWGWKRLGEIDGDWWIVVGVLRPCVGVDKGMQIAGIALEKEDNYLHGHDTNERNVSWSHDEWRIVPIAAIAKGHCVQLMCGRPWAYRAPARLFECRIFRETEDGELGLYIWVPSPELGLYEGGYVVLNGRTCYPRSLSEWGGWRRIADLEGSRGTTRVYVEFEESGEYPELESDFAWGIHVVQSNGGGTGAEYASWASHNAPTVAVASVDSGDDELTIRNTFRQYAVGTICATSVPLRMGGGINNKIASIRSTDGNTAINLNDRKLVGGPWDVGSTVKVDGVTLAPINITINGTSYRLLGKTN